MLGLLILTLLKACSKLIRSRPMPESTNFMEKTRFSKMAGCNDDKGTWRASWRDKPNADHSLGNWAAHPWWNQRNEWFSSASQAYSCHFLQHLVITNCTGIQHRIQLEILWNVSDTEAGNNNKYREAELWNWPQFLNNNPQGRNESRHARFSN